MKKVKLGARKQRDSVSELSRSQYDYDEVIPLEEFEQLSQQLNLAAAQRSNLIDSLYRDNSWYKRQVKFIRSQAESASPYESQYKNWKGPSSQECSFKETYESALNLVTNNKRQSQLKRLTNQRTTSQAIFRYKDRNDKLSNIKELYGRQLQKITNANGVRKQKQGEKQQSRFREVDQLPSSLVKQNPKDRNQSDVRRNMVELAVQKELLGRIRKINDQQKQEQENLRMQNEYKKTCFFDIIRRPPPPPQEKQKTIKRPSNNGVNLSSTDQMKQTIIIQPPLRQKKEEKPKYRLNVEQILQIPHRKFLIFYSENYHQIIGLSSTQEMKKINRYRDQALQKQEVLEKLKKKVAGFGAQKLAKLPPQSREKLFKVLYQKDVEMQKYNAK